MYNPNLHFHFTGIGGTGMSGIAEILIDLGFQVSGSDLSRNAACKRLARLGAEISEGHSADFIPESSSLLVYSSAVADDNVEVQEAKRRGIPVVPRAEVLAELMRLKFGVAVAGSHGKTTTTSLLASIMERGGLDPTVIIGGQVKSIGSGGKLGKGAYLVAESDESDRSFLRLRPTIAVVTNIDTEHLDAYASFGELVQSFDTFIGSVPFYGLSVLCLDCPRVARLADNYEGRKVTYGISVEADVRASNIVFDRSNSHFDVSYFGEHLGKVQLPMPGLHIVRNALAAIAVGKEFGVANATICDALASFSGVKRRLEIVGEINGVTVINDYGHHPTEISASLEAVRAGWKDSLGSLRVVFQPHRYSRTRDCYDDFPKAFPRCDELYVTEIYPAGERPIEGISGEGLSRTIEASHVEFIPELGEISPLIAGRAKRGDVVVCFGAGSIGEVANQIVQELKQA